ncbi:MAG: cytochrome c biogenesis heme-transporting ATPase CcmA [Burkholderiales bacterium]
MLEASGLACERGGRRLFAGLAFTLARGASLRVAGPNGSGKTSLLRILCGLAAPSEGEVRWHGAPIRRLAEEYSRELVYIGHASALKDELTPRENLEIVCRLAGAPARGEALDRALGALAVPDLPTRKLSQGQRRRAALARLVACEALPLWLLDEPFAALDASAARQVEELMAQHLRSGGCLVYTTHQPSALDAAAGVVELG